MQCPNCDNKVNLKKWWKSCKKRTDWVIEYQTKWVANNISKGKDVVTHPKYKQAERLLRKLGFYDEFGI